MAVAKVQAWQKFLGGLFPLVGAMEGVRSSISVDLRRQESREGIVKLGMRSHRTTTATAEQ